ACGFRCIDYPDGLPLRTREGEAFLRINGIQIQGDEIVDMGPELPQLRALQVGCLRLYPQAEGMREVVEHFDLARRSEHPPPRIGAVNGNWHGRQGRPGLPAGWALRGESAPPGCRAGPGPPRAIVAPAGPANWWPGRYRPTARPGPGAAPRPCARGP